MTAPTSLIGMVDDTQYGTIVADVYEHIPALYYPASVPVFAEMRRDSRLTAVVDGYALQIRRAQWQVDPAGCRPEVAQFVADCLGLNVVGDDKASGARRRGVSWNDHLRSALLSQVFGHYAFEMEAEIDRDGRARLITLAERIPATITNIHADPKTGALLGIDQQITNNRQRGPQIPAKNLVFYSRNREGASWQGTSLIRPAYAPWLLKREMMRVNAISNRRWGAGVPVAEALAGTNPTPGQMAEAQRMASAARAGDQAGAAVPPGFTLKIVGLSGSIPDTLGFIRFLNTEIGGAALMPHLDLGTSQSGSRALGESFIDSWTLALESEAEAVADTITRQGAARIVDWNWGEDEPVPRIVVSGVGSRREITAESLKLLLEAHALDADPRLEAWVRREYRLPERDPNAPKPLPAGPPARVPDPNPATPPADTQPEKVAAAATDPVAYETVAAQYDQAVTDMTEQWEQQSGPLVEALAVAAAAAVAGGAVVGLPALTAPTAVTGVLAGVVAAGMLDLAETAARTAAVEVRPIRAVSPALSGAVKGRIKQTARTITDLIVAGYSSAAARVALAQAGTASTAEQVRDAVKTSLTDLSTAKTSGLVAGNLSVAAGTAQGAGREQVFGKLPDGVHFRATEVNDTNRCRECRTVDGRDYVSLDAALVDYPTGTFRACEGRHRCRGFFYAVIADETVAAGRWDEGDHPRDNGGKFAEQAGGGGGDVGVSDLLDPSNPTTRNTLTAHLTAGEGTPDERTTWAAAVADFDQLADQGETASGGKGFDRFRAQLDIAEDPAAVLNQRWSAFKTDAVRAAALRALWQEQDSRASKGRRPAAPDHADIDRGQRKAAKLAQELTDRKLDLTAVDTTGPVRTLDAGDDNPPDFRFINDPETRATYLWQKRYDTQQAVRAGVLNLAAGRDPDDGVDLPTSMRQFTADGYTEQDVRDALNDAARRMFNRFAKSKGVSGSLHRGMYVEGTAEQVRAAFAVGGRLGLPVASFTRKEREARRYAGPADTPAAPRPTGGGVAVVVTVPSGAPTGVDLSENSTLAGSEEVLLMGSLQVTYAAFDDKTNTLYVNAEPVLMAMQQPLAAYSSAGTAVDPWGDGEDVAAGRDGFKPDQRRDGDGMWTRTGGGGQIDAKAAHADLVQGKAVTVDPDKVDALMRLSAGGPIYNLSRMQVTGAENRNLFHRHARDIPRSEMPQLSRKDGSLDAFNWTLTERGISVRKESVDPRRLTATQNQLEGAKVSKLYATLKAQGWPEGSAMFVARDGAVLDGHHRWAAAAAVAVAGPMDVTVLRVDTDIDTLLDIAHTVSAPRKGMEDVALAASRDALPEVAEIVTDTDDGVPEELFAEPQGEVAARRKGFDPNQKRDGDGMWTRTGGGGKTSKPGKGGDAAGYGLMDDAEFEARQKMVADTIGEARKTLATDKTHTTADGAWLPERDKLHREIANELYAKADNVPRDGKAVIAGGLGGAGKSTVLRDHAGIDQSQYLTLNPDDVKELMADRGLVPEVPDHPDLSPMERAALIHEESSRITKLLADMAYRDRRNIIWDITMSSEGGVTSRLADLDSNGYTTRGVFVDIPVEVSVERALTRYRRGQDQYRGGKGMGGRFVPPAIIRAQKTSGGQTVNRVVFDRLTGRFTGWSVYDNSVTGRPPQLVNDSGGSDSGS